MERNAEEEAKKDMTWDQFLQQYQAHINGEISPEERIGGRLETKEHEPIKELNSPPHQAKDQDK